MKILNHTYRDVSATENVILKTPVSELQPTTELNDNSLLHIAQCLSDDSALVKQYESMKITASDFKQKVYEAVQNTFKTEYWDTHCRDGENKPETNHETYDEGQSTKKTSFKDLVEYLDDKDYKPTEVSETEPDGFVKHIYYDFDVLKRYMVLRDDEIEGEIGRLNVRITRAECFFAPRMKLSTTRRNANGVDEGDNASVNHSGNDDMDYCQMHIEPGNKISNVWTCPATGNLVIYGWLDSNDALNNRAIPSAYCVIEAKINSTLVDDQQPAIAISTDSGGDSSSVVEKWEIISAQPVIPAKNITYVGFNLPVRKGLVIRARTGFTVGAKSSQFANDQDGYDTLSNNVPNGFRCMIFSNISYDESKDNDDNT